ncbi:MAG: hypothetical protein ACRDK3_13445 [Actinomycetota bacterium]
MHRSRFMVVAVLVAALTAVGPNALAVWNIASGGEARSKATAMPAGDTPWTSVTNRNVDVSWPAVTMPGGTAVDGYQVFRYDTGGTGYPVTGSCTGVVATLTCTETAMAPGSWHYAVAPVYELWQGAEGPRSSAAVVAAPALNLSGPTTITAVPGTLDGTVANYIPGQTLVMRLDDPVNGPTLSATVTPGSIPADGQATVQVTVPTTVVDGNHVLYAVGSAGDQASASFTVSAPAPTPTSLALTNGGSTAGQIEPGDVIRVDYSGALSVSSICSTWTGDGSNQSAAGTVRLEDDAAASGSDLVLVRTTAPVCGGNFNFGSIDLGSAGFTRRLHEFTATIAYDAGQRRLTVTLSARTTVGQPPRTVNTPVTSTYTPSSAIMGVTGRAITGTASSTAVQF